ncbi:hypothetical protein F5050DRAFT_1812964 [Lentinula boryana]|uniref:Uncharacterized protein n=1 Tax=Lentinula boryana TaxID=40481 RepID=A0ABQ8PXE4_9AGAR|nr:hypothetical protein F5050DRAFT_1812964 [Lentinula boryana]
MSFTSDPQSFYEYAMSLPEHDSDSADSNNNESDHPYAHLDNSSEPDYDNSYHSDSNPDSDAHSEHPFEISENLDFDYSPTGSPEPSETSETSDYHIYLGPDGRLLESERQRRLDLGLCFYCGGEHLQAYCNRLRNRDHFDSHLENLEALEPNLDMSDEYSIDSDHSDSSFYY